VAGDAAVLFNPGDDEHLAAVLRRLLGSPAERAALSERALRRVSERFAWPAVAQATTEQYLQALGKPALGKQELGKPERPTC
jgi:glycosyltransferase involved in cell wall biosynthesis